MKYYEGRWWLILGLQLLDPALAGGKPEVNFGLNIRSLESMKSDLLNSLIPGAKWSQDGTFATCAYNIGVEVKDFAEHKEGSVPSYSLFGTLKKAIPGWNLSASASADSTNNFEKVAAIVTAKGGRTDSTLTVSGVVDTDTGVGEITAVSLDQPINLMGGTLDLTSNYNYETERAGVTVAYARDKTAITLGGTSESQSLTISQTFRDSTTIAPTITYEGDLSVAFSRKVGDGEISGSYVPDSALTLRYSEHPFTANLVVPMDGFVKPRQGTRLSMKMVLPELDFKPQMDTTTTKK